MTVFSKCGAVRCIERLNGQTIKLAVLVELSKLLERYFDEETQKFKFREVKLKELNVLNAERCSSKSDQSRFSAKISVGYEIGRQLKG